MGVLGDYLDRLDAPVRAAIERIYTMTRELVPDVEEGVSYGVPALMHHGRPLVGVQPGAKHLSLFPYSSEVVAAVAPDLAGFSLSKGTIRFSADAPIPDDVLRRIIELRRAEIDARATR
jgi:uncharacterized protein YdhG (YjbR/CyaY superfamily)